jgi:hypothetical protein
MVTFLCSSGLAVFLLIVYVVLPSSGVPVILLNMSLVCFSCVYHFPLCITKEVRKQQNPGEISSGRGCCLINMTLDFLKTSYWISQDWDKHKRTSNVLQTWSTDVGG